MNISIYTSGDFPYGDAAANYIRMMSEGLAACDSKVTVFCTRGYWYNQNRDECIKGISRKNVFLHKKPHNILLKILEFFGLFFMLPISLLKQAVRRKNNIILIYGIDYSYYLIWFILFRVIGGLKVFRIIADSYDKKSISRNRLFSLKYAFYVLQKKFLDKYFTGIICFSNYLKNEQLKYNDNLNKVYLIPHFINMKLDNYPLLNEGLNPGAKKICFAGSFNTRNGIFFLLDAFDDLLENYKGSVQLILIGTPASLSEKEKLIFNDRTKSLIKKNLLLITGRLPFEKVVGYLKSCDILVNPRQKSVESEAGFPTKLGEYLSVFKPVVSTDTGDIPYFFKDNGGVLIADANCYKDFSCKIISLLDNNKRASEIASIAYEWGTRHLDYVKNAKRVIKIVEESV